MKTLNKKLIAVAVVALATLAAPAAYAAPMPTVITNASALDGDFTFTGFVGKKESVTFTYSGATPERVAVGSDDIGKQNYENVGSVLKTVFGTGDFTGYVGQVDSAGGGKTASFFSDIAYNYLAIHLGGTEVMFDFGSKGVAAGKTLSFTTSGQGFSNFRAFSTIKAVTPTPPTPGTSTVPVPGAVWLFGSGLAGLIGMRRRKAAASGLAA